MILPFLTQFLLSTSFLNCIYCVYLRAKFVCNWNIFCHLWLLYTCYTYQSQSQRQATASETPCMSILIQYLNENYSWQHWNKCKITIFRFVSSSLTNLVSKKQTSLELIFMKMYRVSQKNALLAHLWVSDLRRGVFRHKK